MKRKVPLVATIALALLCQGCTENVRSRQFGGSSTQELPVCRKLVLVTWKEASLWTLTRPMRAEDTAESYSFQEDSSLGLMEGTVTITERKGPGCS